MPNPFVRTRGNKGVFLPDMKNGRKINSQMAMYPESQNNAHNSQTPAQPLKPGRYIHFAPTKILRIDCIANYKVSQRDAEYQPEKSLFFKLRLTAVFN